MRSRSPLAAALVVLLAACGARTSLQTPTESTAGSGGSGAGSSGPGGSGPATGAVTSSVGSSTGGSVNVVCPALSMPDPVVVLPALIDDRAPHDPLLESLGESEVLALVRREEMQSMSGLSSVSEVRLAPWGAWPPVIKPPLLVTSDSWYVPFVSSVEPLGTFALGVAPFPKNNPSGCDLAAFYGLSPETPPGPSALPLQLPGKCDEVPVAVATAGNGTHFVAYDTRFGNTSARSLVTQVTDASGKNIGVPDPLCATTSFVGDVLPDETGFLFVHSTSNSATCVDQPFGLGNLLLFNRVEGAESMGTVVHYGTDAVVYTRILPRSGGAWVLFRESGASAEVQPPGMALKIAGDMPAGEAFPVTPPGTDRMASAAFGDGFVVAYVDNIDPSAPKIFVRVYDGSGTLVSEVSFDTNGAWLTRDRLTLTASPDARSFLVSWIGATEPDGSEMFVRRFDCVPHE